MSVVALLLLAACSAEDPAEGPVGDAGAAPPAPSGPCAGGSAPPGGPADDLGDHQIAYVSDRDGGWDVWLARSDGSDPRRVTDDEGLEWTPAWSPDGRRLAFACAATEDSPSDLYVVDADGSHRTRVTDTPDRCESSPMWTPDATRLLFSAGECGGREGVWEVDLDGGAERRVLEDASWPALSPDGTRLAYSLPRGDGGFLDASLWVSDSDGSGATELGPPGVQGAYEASWSPDGSRIAFVVPTGDPTSEDPVEWNEDVYVMDADGTSVRRVTRTPGNDHWPPAWSPDGSTLLYSSDGLANRVGRLVAVDVRTGRTTAVTERGVTALLPTWRE